MDERCPYNDVSFITRIETFFIKGRVNEIPVSRKNMRSKGKKKEQKWDLTVQKSGKFDKYHKIERFLDIFKNRFLKIFAFPKKNHGKNFLLTKISNFYRGFLMSNSIF